MQIAREAWGDVPDWVEAIVVECDRTSQGKVAKRMGRSPSVVSQVIRNVYNGAMPAIEDRARAVFCETQQKCPALGWISSADCLGWRDQAAELTSSSPIRVRMFRACNACPVYTKEDAE